MYQLCNKNNFFNKTWGSCISSLVLGSVLSACVVVPITPPQATTTANSVVAPTTNSIPNPTLAPPSGANAAATLPEANTLLQQGKKLEAAQAYYRASQRYPSPQKDRIILQAAEITAAMGNEALTEQYLSRTNSAQLDGEGFVRLRYVQALLALQTQQPDVALRLLPPELDQDSSATLIAKLNHVRNKARQQGANFTQAPKPDNIRQNPNSYTAPYQEDSEANAAPQSSTNNQSALPNQLQRLAVLLPKSGSLGEVSQQIYQGIQAAQTQVGQNTRIKLYDVNNGGVASQYRSAVADGADMIVGPLDKEALQQLISEVGTLDRPVLSLNYLEGNNTTAGLYQFGLAPEDEAQQIAQFALHRGQQRAIVLAPDSSWGKRLAQAFEHAYENQGGQILRSEAYPNDPSGYLERIQSAFASNQGQAQMVFLAASPTQARLIRPLIAGQASLIPVYATSHIFSGIPDPNNDADLDGIIYTEIPWVLDRAKSGRLGDNKYPRMYALGIDAFLIAKNLANLAYGHQALKGKTGQVRLLPNHHIQRSLDMATFINGQPAALGQ